MAENKGRKKFLALSVLLHALFFSVLFYDWQTTSKPVGPDASMIDISGIAVSTALPPQTSSVIKKTSRLDRHKLHHSVMPRLQKQKKITHRHPENRAIDKHLSSQQAKEKAIEKRRAQQQAKEKAIEKRRAQQQSKEKATEKRRAQQQAKEKAAFALKKKEALQRQHQLLLSQERAINAQLVKQQKKSELQRVDRLEAAQQRLVDRSKVDQYRFLIQQKVKRFWNWPLKLDQVYCRVELTLADDGSVLAVHLLKSSGNVAFDNSAMQAVKRASPLPVPKEKNLYLIDFKHVTMTMSPHESGFGTA